MNHNSLADADDAKPLLVRRGRVESVDLYEIKDGELDLLEEGSPADLQLNFAIFLFSTAFSAIAALCTASFPSQSVENSFLIVAVIGILMGGYLLISWWFSRKSLAAVCKRIRQRIPPALTAAAQVGEPSGHQDSGDSLLPRG